MKTLQDACFDCLAKNLDKIKGLNKKLAPRHRDILMKRLSDHDLLSQDYLPHVTYNLFSKYLTTIEFYKCEQITNKILQKLANCKCKLKSITIHRCDNVTDVGIQAITKKQTDLHSLILRHSKISDKGLTQVESAKLKKVDLRGSQQITAAGLKPLFKKNPNIEVLVLVACKMDAVVFDIIAESLGQNLLTLDAAYLHTLTDESLITLATKCTNLKTLNITGCNKVTGKSLAVLNQQCQQLREVDLSYCINIYKCLESDSPLSSLQENLRELSLCGVLIESKDLLVNSVIRLKKLRSIQFCGIPSLCDDTLTKIVQEIGKDLEEIDISYNTQNGAITDDSLRAISKHCKSLECLHMNLLGSITGVGLLPLLEDSCQATSLRELTMSCREMEESVLMKIADNCTGLERFDVAGLIIVTDDLLLRLAANCPNLNRIGVKGCIKVTDLSVCELAYQCPLRFVVLAGINNITDQSIFALANHCPYLEQLYLNGCAKISKVTLNYIQDCCISRCYIQHKVPNAPEGQLMAKNLDTGEFCRADTMEYPPF